MNIKHYTVDEYGVVNYKTRYLTLMGMAIIYGVIGVGALALQYFEGANPNANIHTYGEAFWVLIMASSTIGFGDYYPTTGGGYVVVTLMFYIGVGMMGFIGALVASKLMGFSDTNVKNRELRQQNAQILAKLEQMSQELQSIKGKH